MFKSPPLFSSIMTRFIFSNIIGSFVFNEKHKLLDGLLFKDIEQYKDKKIYEEKLIKKHKNLTTPKDNDLHNILLLFKNKKYFYQFYNKNLNITKNSVKESVNNDNLIIQTINCIEEYSFSII